MKLILLKATNAVTCDNLDKVGIMHSTADLWQLRQLVTQHDPPMLQDVMQRDAMPRVHVQHPRNQVFC